MKNRWAWALAVALGVVLIFWKITLSRQFSWMNGDDTVHQVLPWLQMQAREWHRGHFPVLDPFHWAGQSLIGQTQPGALFPFNWLLFLSPMKHGRLQTGMLNWYFVLIHVLGAWAMLALLRGLGMARPAAALLAVVFGAGGFLATVDWPQMLNGAICLPAAALGWVLFLRRPGHFVYAAAAGVAAGFSILAGHHSAPIAILCAVAGLTGYALYERRWTQARLRCYAAGLAVFGVFFFLAGAAQTLPAMEYWRVSYRFVNAKEPVTFDQQIPYAVHRHYSLNAASLPGLVVNGFHREAALNPFLGVTVTALAAAGFAAFRRRFAARLFLFLGVFSLLLAFGEDSVLHGIFFARFPLFDKLRNPSMLILNVHLALIVLAAMGWTAVREGRLGAEWGRWLWRAGAAVFALLTALYAVDAGKAAGQAALAQAAFFAGGLGLVLVSRASARTKGALAAALVLVEVGSNTTRSFPDREMGFANYDSLSMHDDIAAYLQAERKKTPFRITVAESVSPKNFGDWYGLEQVNGYMGMSINMFRDQWRPQVPQLLGARFHVGPEARLPDQVKRFTGRSGVHVWESPEYAPWAWTAHEFERIDEGRLLEAYLPGWPALRGRVFALRGEAKVASCDGTDEVRLTNLEPERGRVEVAMACDGLLVYSTAVLPGWTATVDGAPAEIIEAYGKLTAVAVPAGRHTVEFRYAPGSVRLGAGLSLACVMGLAVWWWLSRRTGPGFQGRRRRAVT